MKMSIVQDLSNNLNSDEKEALVKVLKIFIDYKFDLESDYRVTFDRKYRINTFELVELRRRKKDKWVFRLQYPSTLRILSHYKVIEARQDVSVANEVLDALKQENKQTLPAPFTVNKKNAVNLLKELTGEEIFLAELKEYPKTDKKIVVEYMNLTFYEDLKLYEGKKLIKEFGNGDQQKLLVPLMKCQNENKLLPISDIKKSSKRDPKTLQKNLNSNIKQATLKVSQDKGYFEFVRNKS